MSQSLLHLIDFNKTPITMKTLQSLNLVFGFFHLGIPLTLNIGEESELADGFGKPISNSQLSVPAVLPVKPTGVHETNDLITKIMLYPNPAGNKVWIEFDLSLDADVEVDWYNVVGELIKTNHFDGLAKGIYRRELKISALSNGVYTLKIMVNGRNSTNFYHKLVISK